MKITFGILTYKSRENYALQSVQSIKKLQIPSYEIIVVGGDNCYSQDNENITHIDFDEEKVKGWVTKKKNLITKYSNFETIVIQADYVIYDKNWYKNLLKYGDKFHILSNKILKENGQRHHDWNLSKTNNNRFDKHIKRTNEKILPYNIDFLSKYMYITGSFFITKKFILEEYPFNEHLVYGQGDDVEWSHRVRKKYNFSFNEFSEVRIIDKDQNRFYKKEASIEFIEKYQKFDNSKISKIIDKIYYGIFLYYFMGFAKTPYIYLNKGCNKILKLIFKREYYIK